MPTRDPMPAVLIIRQNGQLVRYLVDVETVTFDVTEPWPFLGAGREYKLALHGDYLGPFPFDESETVVLPDRLALESGQPALEGGQ